MGQDVTGSLGHGPAGVIFGSGQADHAKPGLQSVADGPFLARNTVYSDQFYKILQQSFGFNQNEPSTRRYR
jgi:hypothetical protein